MLGTILCLSFSTAIQKKSIRENGFDIECYVSLKKLTSFELGKTYYWYKSGGLHQSEYSAGGLVLHDVYSKYYRSNQIAEQGVFNYGLKNGVWKGWHTNGVLKEHEEWKNGFKHGAFITYDDKGVKTSFGEYKNNLKSGVWINYITKDTTSYVKDKAQPKKEKKASIFKRLFKKKDSSKTIETPEEKATSKSKKDNFFKRLFKKKKKTNKLRKSQVNKAQETPKTSTTVQPEVKKKEGFFKRLFKKKKHTNKENIVYKN